MIKLPYFLAIALANRMRETNRTARDRGVSDPAARPHRDIGPIGTVARVILGSILFGSVFYGLSMLLAALRGYAGCEALAISNWLLKRDDQLGCLVFGPVDYTEGKLFPGSNTVKKVKC